MALLSTLHALIRTLAAYWELRAKRYEHDVRELSRARIETLEDELERLRNSATGVDTVMADRLRNRILSERAYLKHLPDAHPAP